ncbi:MAG: hypothetical protein JKY24_08045 [Pseudomonadales bacterium]|nr:hypothetical protein [Pseudomonadales bacterium]
MAALKPQDIMIVLKICTLGGEPWSQGSLAQSLSMSSSEINGGLKRCLKSGLVRKQEDGKYRPLKHSLEEFLFHGLKYVFPPERGEPTRGQPTAYAGPALKEHIQQGNDLPPVWPDPEGSVKGYAFEPLFPSVVKAIKNDEKLYRLLSLVDALRDGRAREIKLAQKLIKNELSS